MGTSLFTVIPSIIKLPSSQSTDTSWKVTNHEKSYYGSEVSPRFVGDSQKLVEIIRIEMNKLIFFQRNFYHCNQLKIPQIVVFFCLTVLSRSAKGLLLSLRPPWRKLPRRCLFPEVKKGEGETDALSLVSKSHC